MVVSTVVIFPCHVVYAFLRPLLSINLLDVLVLLSLSQHREVFNLRLQLLNVCLL